MMTTMMSTTTSISTNYYHNPVLDRVFIFCHRCPYRFFVPMAHFPRWISSYNVASEAMHFAYATAVSRDQEALRSIGCIGELTIICHEPSAPKDMGPILLGTKVVYCPNKEMGASAVWSSEAAMCSNGIARSGAWTMLQPS